MALRGRCYSVKSTFGIEKSAQSLCEITKSPTEIVWPTYESIPVGTPSTYSPWPMSPTKYRYTVSNYGQVIIHKEKNNRMKKIKKIPVYPKSSWSTSGKNYFTFNMKCKNLDISVKNQHILKYQNNFTKLTREDSE